MLSRHADNLFWLARYVERAENTARIIETASRVATMPVGETGETNEWALAVAATGCEASFFKTYTEANSRTVVDFLAFNQDNSSSIRSCFAVARSNARAVRTALTLDMWETINSAWLDMRRFRTESMSRPELNEFLSWVKEVSLRFDGSAHRTMLRNDAFYFERLGMLLERADATARILAVKAQYLEPGSEARSGSLEYYQWSSILRAVSALTSYHWVYRQNLRPELVADLLVFREEMPRSLISCYRSISQLLDGLAQQYGRQGIAQRTARETLRKLETADLDRVMASSLPEFLDQFITDNNRLGSAISEQYLL